MKVLRDAVALGKASLVCFTCMCAAVTFTSVVVAIAVEFKTCADLYGLRYSTAFIF